MPDGMMERLTGAVPAEFGPVRPLPSGRARTLALFGLWIGVALVLGFVNTGKGWRALSGEQRWTLWGPLAALALVLAAELSQRMVPGSRLRSRPWWLAVVGVTIPVVWTVASTPVAARSRLFYGICVLFTSAGAALCSVAMVRYMRRGYVTEASTRIAFAAAAGLAGFSAVEVFCPYVDMAHILTSHVLPGVLAGAGAAWVSWREFR